MDDGKRTRYGVVALVVLLLVAVFVVPRVMRSGRETRNGGAPGDLAILRVPTGSKTLDEAAGRAAAEGKPVYLEFTAAWCPACSVFKKEVLSDPAVREALKQVVHVDVDVDSEGMIAERFGVVGIPAGFLLKMEDGSLKVLDKHEGMLDKKEFLKFIARKG